MNEQFWWFVARSTGIVAWVLAVAAVLWGLALAAGMVKRPGPAWMLAVHRHLGVLTLGFTAAHLAALMADSYVEFDLADLLVPYASEWRPGVVAWGVLALWLLVVVEVTSLLRRRIPNRAWRSVHLTSYLAAIAATLHGAGAGTDAGHPALRLAPTVAVAVAVIFLTYRALLPRRRARRPAVT